MSAESTTRDATVRRFLDRRVVYLILTNWSAISTIRYMLYTLKFAFPARSMKTKDLFHGYPRKISLLKDLA
jgi:hypothetical protein